MSSLRSQITLVILLLMAFIEYMGVGLVFPLFPCLLFDPSLTILASDVPNEIRGELLGYLIAINPLAIFLAAPVWGALSDRWGRKRVLSLCLLIGVLGYAVAVYAIWHKSILFLFVYRILSGCSAGGSAVVQAAISDESTPLTKVKNFAYYNMAWGAGFSLGPFVGGVLSDSALFSSFGVTTPFLFAGILLLVNWVLLFAFYNNSLQEIKKTAFSIRDYFSNLYYIFQKRELKIIFISMFVFSFGWDFFIEFVSVYLIQHFHFSPSEVGSFHGLNGIVYALGTAVLAKGFMAKRDPLKVLITFFFALSVYLLAMMLVNNAAIFWLMVPILILMVAVIYPTAGTIISDNADKESQGEVMGVYSAALNLALMLSPVIFGRYVADLLSLPLLLGSLMAACAGTLLWGGLRARVTSSEG